MWSGSKAIPFAISERMTCLPSSVRPRELQCGPAPYAGAAMLRTGPKLSRTRPASASTPSAPAGVASVGLSWVRSVADSGDSRPVSCSWSWPSVSGVQVRMSQKWPVTYLLPALTTMPVWPGSPVTPDSALSNLLTSWTWRTPMSKTSCRRSSIWAFVHCGWSRTSSQSNSADTSMPSRTASRPAWMTSRACVGVLTTRSQPSPGPPFIAST